MTPTAATTIAETADSGFHNAPLVGVRRYPARWAMKVSASMAVFLFVGCVGSRNYLKARTVPSTVTPASSVVSAEVIESPSSTQQGTANVSTRDVTGLSYSSALPWGMAIYLLFREIGVVIEGYFSHRRRLTRISKGLPES